jgi:hypothetical protein
LHVTAPQGAVPREAAAARARDGSAWCERRC